MVLRKLWAGSLSACIHFLKKCMLQWYHIIMCSWLPVHQAEVQLYETNCCNGWLSDVGYFLWCFLVMDTRETKTGFTKRSKLLEKQWWKDNCKPWGWGVESSSYLSGWIILNESFSPHVPRLITVLLEVTESLVPAKDWEEVWPPIVSKALANMPL